MILIFKKIFLYKIYKKEDFLLDLNELLNSYNIYVVWCDYVILRNIVYVW